VPSTTCSAPRSPTSSQLPPIYLGCPGSSAASPARGHSNSLTERAHRPKGRCSSECGRRHLRGAPHAAPIAPADPDPNVAWRLDRPRDDRACDHGAGIGRTDDGATGDVDSIASGASADDGEPTDLDDHTVWPERVPGGGRPDNYDGAGRPDDHLKHVDGVRRADDDVIERAGEH
jgi:hypothetical protein